MNLAIIAAGESSRIKSEGIKIPKPLIRISGESIIHRIIRIGIQNQMTAIYCIVNEQETLLREYFITEKFSVPLKLIIKTTESSMHSLFALAPDLRNAPFCLTTSDSVFDENEFAGFIAFCRSNSDSDGILAVTDYIDDEKPLCVKIDDCDLIQEFSDTKDGYNWATGGIYYFSPSVFEMIPKARGGKIMRLRNFLRLLLENNYKLKAYPFSKIIDVDHKRDIDVAKRLIVKKKYKV